MEPVSLIVGALTQSAAAAASGVASKAITQAYEALVDLLRRKLKGSGRSAEVVLEKHKEAPELYEKPLEHELGVAKVAEDAEVVASAQTLQKVLEGTNWAVQSNRDSYTVGKAIKSAIGPHAKVENQN